MANSVMCKTCCSYPSNKCICPPKPSQPVMALAISPKQSLQRGRRGVARVIAGDVNSLVLRAWFVLGNKIKAWEERVMNVTRDVYEWTADAWRSPLYFFLNVFFHATIPFLIGIPFCSWWCGSSWWDGHGYNFEHSPRGKLKKWEQDQRTIVPRKIKDYIKSVNDRSREEL